MAGQRTETTNAAPVASNPGIAKAAKSAKIAEEIESLNPSELLILPLGGLGALGDLCVSTGRKDVETLKSRRAAMRPLHNFAFPSGF